MEPIIAIYVFTHKPFAVPSDVHYIPLHVGRSLWRQRTHSAEEEVAMLSYLGDDTGDHISDQNGYFSELTGMYWVWKQSAADVVGSAHYRRYLLDPKYEGCMYTTEGILRDLAEYDVITTKELELNDSYYDGFAFHHRISYLDETKNVIADLYPEYEADFEKMVHGNHTYFGNMLICKKALFDAYCSWLFSILFELQRRVVVEEEDDYHRRIFGFISEFLQYVYIRHHHLRVRECMVGMVGEKIEVRQTKEELARFFAKGDIAGAKAYLLEARKRRPDLMMEASDITGELHLCMELIAIAERENANGKTSILEQNFSYSELMHYANALNRFVLRQIKTDAHGKSSPFQAMMTRSEEGESFTYSKEALDVATQVMAASIRKNKT